MEKENKMIIGGKTFGQKMTELIKKELEQKSHSEKILIPCETKKIKSIAFYPNYDVNIEPIWDEPKSKFHK